MPPCSLKAEEANQTSDPNRCVPMGKNRIFQANMLAEIVGKPISVASVVTLL